MAAVITLTSVAVASDGKTVTATLGGGTAPYAVASTAGIDLHNTSSQHFVPTSASVSGTTLTVVLSAAFLSGQTAQVDITAANTITDSGGNTGAAVTNQAATNGSAVTGALTTVTSNLGLFNWQGAPNTNTLGAGTGGLAPSWIAASSVGYVGEFVVTVTAGTVDVDFAASLTGGGVAAYWSVDGAAPSSYTGRSMNYDVFRAASALGVGKHVVRFGGYSNFMLHDVRITGTGTATITTVPCPVAIFKDSVANLTLPSTVSPVKRWGTITYSGNQISAGHPGFSFQFNGNFQGADIVALTHAGGSTTYRATAVDNAAVPAGPDSYTLSGYTTTGTGIDNSYQVQPLVNGLAPGVHGVEVLDITTFTYLAVRVWNGSALTASASAGNNTITVGSVTNIAVGDWVCLDYTQSEEIVRVDGISGTTLTLNRNLAGAHASGASVRNFTPATAPTLTTGTAPTFRGRVMVLGDSISHAEAISPAGTFPASGYASYDVRASHAFIAARAAGFEFISGAQQGWTAANLVSDNAANNRDANKPATVYTILIGINDYNSNVALATYEANLETIIGQIKTAAPGGCTILVYKIFGANPAATNAGGKTRSDYNAQQVTAIGNTQAAGYTIQQVDLSTNLNTAANNVDIPDGTHPSITSGGLAGTGGQNKMATQFLAYLNTINPSAGMFFAA